MICSILETRRYKKKEKKRKEKEVWNSDKAIGLFNWSHAEMSANGF
jgi:hypothetical protein